MHLPNFISAGLTWHITSYLNVAVPDVACTFEQLRSSAYGHKLRLLIGSLAENSHNPWIISALM
jgi:hypothetical protein